MADQEVERSIFDGPGKIITARVGGQIYPNILVSVGKIWVFVKSIGSSESSLIMGDSIISVFRKATTPMTTNKFRNFLFAFGLTLQDLFNDSPDQTNDFIGKICKELLDKICTKKEINLHTLQNLKEWADSLTSESSQKIKKILDDTVVKLQNLPDNLPMPTIKPKITKSTNASAVEALQKLGARTNRLRKP